MNGERGLRDRKKRQTRAALGRAAVTLVAERGYDQVTVEDISNAADVSPRTFFNYFASKDDALAAPDPDGGARLRARVVGRPAEEGPVAAVHAAVLAEITEELAGDRELWLLRMRVVQQYPELLARVFAGGEAAERQLAAGIAERIGATPTDVYPLLLAAAVSAACRVAFILWAEPDDPRPLENLIGEALDLLAAGLGAPPES
ncbi:TetR/AcrR family transcriptional regulator [Saccharothrix obliqua]|uniref:TetR/AcrR family transcriptional regulator n=1 Tax=Saccharothrix obliqua TaxID=2861747 RepID=UPI0027E21DD5|nr:TetR family transcriptional regulator [Saccharothrix obliqua]